MISIVISVAFIISSFSLPSQAVNAYDNKWGTFSTVKISGSGPDVVELKKPLRAGVIVMHHAGDHNFIVQSLNSRLGTDDLLANEIGNYTGSAVFGLGYSSSKVYGFEVEAEGRWTLTLKSFSKAAALGTKGTGSGVYKAWFNRRKIVKFTHDGDHNFIVQQYCTNGTSDLLINEIGPYSGKKIVSAGSCLIQVTADGNWTIK